MKNLARNVAANDGVEVSEVELKVVAFIGFLQPNLGNNKERRRRRRREVP